MEKIEPTQGLKITPINGLELKKISIPILSSKVPAGFPSPAESFLDDPINLHDFLFKNPSSTYCFWVEGASMIEAGILDGDLVICDYSLEPHNGDIVVGVIDGEFTLKQIHVSSGKLYLKPRNEKFKPIEITENMNFKIHGIITNTIHTFRK
ncbi:MAG: translesion error-prone DNA polymerase V autoproteolytic subunit [Bacteroidetes bacterium]|nr:translesion error-prone DNA polymerase V autoproteolytic subunit [Bacteroidota bacterium]